MKDCEGTELAVGDNVAIITGYRRDRIARGIIVKINIQETTLNGTGYRSESIGVRHSKQQRISTFSNAGSILKLT